MAALTTADGTNATKLAGIKAGTLGVGSFVDGANDWGSKVRMSYDTYSLDTGDTAAAGMVITMGRIPEGSRVLGFLVTNNAFGSAVTADLQLVDSDGNITTATASEGWTDLSTAQGLFIPALTALQTAKLDEDHDVTVTTAAQGMVAADVMTVAALYTVED